MGHRANYATLSVQEALGPSEDHLDVPWAAFAGDRSSSHAFEVPAEAAADPYLQIQAFDVEEYGHDILLNGESLSGFDIPPAEGWQAWMDTITGPDLREGENTLRIERDTTTEDAFAVGTVVVNWREPV
jgi:hypothetical protein